MQSSDMAPVPPPAARHNPLKTALVWLLELNRPVPQRTEDELAAEVERNYNWNFAVNLLDGTWFLFGISFISSTTILPLFLSKLTTAPLAFGILAVTAQAGWFLPQIFTANLMERLARRGCKTIILEEGAVCGLAKLHSFGSELIRSECAKRWWDEMYQRWAETLDLVVLLEASVPTLLQRVRSRGQQFEIGQMTDEEAMKYLASIRVAQGKVLSALTAIPGGPQILRVNSEDCTLDHIALLMR